MKTDEQTKMDAWHKILSMIPFDVFGPKPPETSEEILEIADKMLALSLSAKVCVAYPGAEMKPGEREMVLGIKRHIDITIAEQAAKWRMTDALESWYGDDSPKNPIEV